MIEQDAMTRLAAANPVPDAEVRDSATSSRALLLQRAVLAQPRSPRRRLALVPGPRWRYALVPAALAAVAVAAFAVVHRTPPRAPAPVVASTATPQSILAAAARMVCGVAVPVTTRTGACGGSWAGTTVNAATATAATAAGITP